MSQLLTLLLYGLGVHITLTGATTPPPCNDPCRDPGNCPPNPALKWAVCKNRPPEGQNWACADPKLDFPTVECLVADMKTCGIIGQNTVFYSFGAVVAEAQEKFRDTLNPKGVMYEDALDEEYWTTVVMDARFAIYSDKTDLNGMNRLDIITYRCSEAMAVASTGDSAYLVVKQRNGAGGGVGVYQKPLAGSTITNVWLTYEFPALQQNTAIKKIYSVDASNNFLPTLDWERGKEGQVALPPGNADSLAIPPLAPPCSPKFRRDSAACASPCGSGTSTSPTTTTTNTKNTPTVTPPPKPSCSMQNQDPDQGITSGYCVCDKTKTLPLLSVATTAMATEQCNYASIPGASTIKPTGDLGPATTNSKLCQVCTPVVNNEDSCTQMTNCLPQAAAATVEAGTSPVHVGTLTGTALYTSISSALEKICPPVTQTTSATSCQTDAVTIGGIDYIANIPGNPGGTLAKGELVVKVESSSYNVTSLRDAMINTAALTAQNSAQGKNCYSAEYIIEEFRKRSSSSWIGQARRWLAPLTGRGDLLDRALVQEKEHITLCNAGHSAGVQYYGQFWRFAPEPGPTDHLDAGWEFQIPPAGDFICDFLAGLIDALVLIEPEFAVGEIELGQEIGAICRDTINGA